MKIAHCVVVGRTKICRTLPSISWIFVTFVVFHWETLHKKHVDLVMLVNQSWYGRPRDLCWITMRSAVRGSVCRLLKTHVSNSERERGCGFHHRRATSSDGLSFSPASCVVHKPRLTAGCCNSVNFGPAKSCFSDTRQSCVHWPLPNNSLHRS